MEGFKIVVGSIIVQMKQMDSLFGQTENKLL